MQKRFRNPLPTARKITMCLDDIRDMKLSALCQILGMTQSELIRAMIDRNYAEFRSPRVDSELLEAVTQ